MNAATILAAARAIALVLAEAPALFQEVERFWTAISRHGEPPAVVDKKVAALVTRAKRQARPAKG